MKSLKQIADEIGIDKQKVYRFVTKNHIKESHQIGKTKQYNEAVEKLIKHQFDQEVIHQEPVQNHIEKSVFDVIEKQLEEKSNQLKVKDLQIDKLNQALNQQQQLHLKLQQDMTHLLESNQQLLEYKSEQENKGFWARLFSL